MSNILHSSEGLTIKRNTENGFVIASLHFTADPQKRSEAWAKEAAAGMTEAQFAREYNLDYTAVQGAKVFPELTQRKSSIVIDAPFPSFKDCRCYAGLDYGTRNPASFHVYSIVDGVVYSIWELYEPCKNIPDFVEKMQSCPYWSQIRYIAADPSLWTPSQQQEHGSPISVQELFWKSGIRNMVRGRNDTGAEEAWLAIMRRHWSSEDTTFRILSCCVEQIRELSTLIFTPQTERQLLNTVYREAINDKDNHSADDCKYMMLSLPAQQAPRDWKDANMVSRWQARPSQAQQPQTGRKRVGNYQ